VLAEQQRNAAGNLQSLQAMREHARTLSALTRNGFDPIAFGRILDETWRLKRRLAATITNDRIDAWYERALGAGAVGGKLCGAGGGGFLLFVMPPERRPGVRQALGDLTDVPIGYEAQGSRVLLPVLD
jgi:D-glycero-alpha-D-manno-heptose-7-phosphate kinase